VKAFVSYVALALALAFLTTGCDDKAAILHSQGKAVLVGPSGGGDNNVGYGVGGSVSMAGSCVGLAMGSEHRTVIWPNGTKIVSEDPFTLDVPGVGRVSLGDTLAGGGHDVSPDRLPDGIESVPSNCPSADLMAFLPDH